MSNLSFNHHFPKTHRLLTPADYKHVFDKARRFSNAHWTILVRAYDSDNSPARLGLIIAKKQVSKAHERNRLKRIAREAFRHHQAELTNKDLVVLVKRGIDAVENEQLNRTFINLLRKIAKSDLTDLY